MEIWREINPQPKLPIVGFFHSSEEDYEDYEGWCYQHPESDPDMPNLIYNAPYKFEDKNQPGKIGDFYEGGKITERVKVRIKEGVAYWVVNISIKNAAQQAVAGDANSEAFNQETGA